VRESDAWLPESDPFAEPPPLSYAVRQSAVPVIAKRVSLPERAGTVSLLDNLSPELATLYADITNIITLPDKPVLDGTFFGSHHEYLELISRLRAADMISFTTDPAFVNSVFAVPKADGSLRLILDARPVNEHSTQPANPDLPDPSLICGLMLPGKTRLYTAKTDLSNAFFMVRLPDSWHRYFAMPAVRAGEIGLPGFAPDCLVYPCLSVLAMGWSHSCLIMQDIHVQIVLQDLPADQLVSPANDPLLDRLRAAVYLDDISWMGTNKRTVQLAIDRYVRTCQQRGFLIKADKNVPPQLRGVESLGFEVDGIEGTVGVSPRKLHALIVRTNALLAANYATGRDMASLVGSWTWAALARRPALSLFSAVYRFIESAASAQFHIWNSVKTELRAIVSIAPLLVADLRADWFPRVVATDASEFGLGVVSTPSSCDELTALLTQACQPEGDLRHPQLWLASSPEGETVPLNQGTVRSVSPALYAGVSRDAAFRVKTSSTLSRGERAGSHPHGSGSRVLGTSPVPDPVAPESMSARVKPLPFAASSRRWTTIVAHHDRNTADHINCRELRAIAVAMRWVLSYSASVNRRIFLVSDSLVALNALAKGRSSSFTVRSRLRAIAAMALAADLQLRCFYVPNPADRPSRFTNTSWLDSVF